jgi:hypothetical protein
MLAHFIPMKTTNSVEEMVPLYMKEVLMLHDVPKPIVSYRDSKLFPNFGEICMMLWAQSFL